MPRMKHQQGVALITAMLVVSLATLAVVALASRQSMDIRRTANVIESEQAYLYSLGIEAVAKVALQKYAESGKHYDDPDILYQPQAFPVDNGMVSGSLIDMEARFNVNTLLNEKGERNEVQVLRFERLVRIVADKLQEVGVEPTALSAALMDWMDGGDNETRLGGAEDGEYLAKETPYRAANRMLASATELFLVEGFSPELLRGKTIEEEQVPGLLHYVVALPDHFTTINVNTVLPEVLMCISDKFDAKNVDSLVSGRPFKDVNEFKDQQEIKSIRDEIKDQNLKKAFDADLVGLDVETSYFMVSTNSTVGRSVNILNSLIYRDTGGRKEILTVSRAQGGDEFIQAPSLLAGLAGKQTQSN